MRFFLLFIFPICLASALEWQDGFPSIVCAASVESNKYLMDVEGNGREAKFKVETYYPDPGGAGHILKSSTHRDHINIISMPYPTGAMNFTAIAADHYTPLDAKGAVGPNQFIAVSNHRIRTFDKKTGIADKTLDLPLDLFFRVVLPDDAYVMNPHIRYDRFSDCWYLVALCVEGGLGRKVLLGVSYGGNIVPNTSWSFFSFHAGQIHPARFYSSFIDSVSLGIDNKSLYIGVNVFDEDSRHFLASDVFIIPKKPLLYSGLCNVTAFRDLPEISPQGVDIFDSQNREGFFLSNDRENYGSLVLRRVRDPGGFPQLSEPINIEVLSTAKPLEGKDHLGCCHIRDGRLYATHCIGVDFQGVSHPNRKLTRNGCRYYQIDLQNLDHPRLEQSATLFDNKNPFSTLQPNYFCPAIMSNGLHSLLFSCNVSGSCINGALTIHHASDPPGVLTPPSQFTRCQEQFHQTLWPNHGQISVDPNDNMTLWCIQPYSNGLQTIRIQAPPPPQTISCSPQQIKHGEKTAKITIKGTNKDASAFYQPPFDFPNRLHVEIENVKVLSYDKISPQQIKLTISTENTPLGIKIIEIINPDGQKTIGKLTIVN